MCGLETALALGATAAGSVHNARQQQSYVDAVNQQNNIASQQAEEFRRAEQGRQDEIGGERRATFMDVAEAADPGARGEELDGAAERALDEVLSARRTDGTLPTWMQGSGDAAPSLSDRVNRVVSDKRGRLEAGARLRAERGGQSDTGLALQRGFAEQDFLGDKMRGSLGVSQQERAISPASVSQPTGALGDILLAGGQYAANRAGYSRGRSDTMSGG